MKNLNYLMKQNSFSFKENEKREGGLCNNTQETVTTNPNPNPNPPHTTTMINHIQDEEEGRRRRRSLG